MDTELIERCAEETGAIVTAENRNACGGPGSAAEHIAEAAKKAIERK